MEPRKLRCSLFVLISQRRACHYIGRPGRRGISLSSRSPIGVDEYIDLVAERATALGGTALGTLQVVAKTSTLAAYPIDISAGREHVDALASALAAFGRLARASIDRAAAVLGDIDTGAVFTDVSRGIDSDLGLLEAHVQAER